MWSRPLGLSRLPRRALEPSQNPQAPLGRAHNARVFAVDVLTCPHCGGARRLIAMITDGLVVRRILGPPRAAQHSSGDRPRKSAARARVRLVVHDASELRTSKEAQFGGAVPRAAKPAPPNQRLRPARRGSRGGAEQLDVRPRDRIHSSGGSRPPGEAARTGPNRPNRDPLPGVIRLEFLSPPRSRGNSTRTRVSLVVRGAGELRVVVRSCRTGQVERTVRL